MNADSRSSRVFINRNKGTKKPKSRSQHLNSLTIFVLSMHLLETKDVSGVKELLEIFEFKLSVLLFGKHRSNETSGVPGNTSHAFGKERGTSIPTCSTL